MGKHRDAGRDRLLYAGAMLGVLVLLWLGGDNGFVYTLVLLGVPIGSGILAGLGRIRFWHAVLGCLVVVAIDVMFDESRGEDAAFFAVLAVVMIGIATLTRWATKRLTRRRPGGQPMPATDAQT